MISCVQWENKQLNTVLYQIMAPFSSKAGGHAHTLFELNHAVHSEGNAFWVLAMVRARVSVGVTVAPEAYVHVRSCAKFKCKH